MGAPKVEMDEWLPEDEDFAVRSAQRMERIQEFVRIAHEQAQHRAKERADGRAKQIRFKVGDLVYKYDSAAMAGSGSKLKNRWVGPYVIESEVTPVTFAIHPEGRNEKIERVHANRLKKYELRRPVLIRTIGSPLEKTDEPDELQGLIGTIRAKEGDVLHIPMSNLSWGMAETPKITLT